jgi:cytochrome c2
MDCFGKSTCLALALAGIIGAAAADDDQVRAGRQVVERRCRNCRGVAAPAHCSIGPSANRIAGSRAGANASGIHSPPVMDSGIVRDHVLLRFLSKPQREIPGTVVAAHSTDQMELASLLGKLESQR